MLGLSSRLLGPFPPQGLLGLFLWGGLVLFCCCLLFLFRLEAGFHSIALAGQDLDTWIRPASNPEVYRSLTLPLPSAKIHTSGVFLVLVFGLFVVVFSSAGDGTQDLRGFS